MKKFWRLVFQNKNCWHFNCWRFLVKYSIYLPNIIVWMPLFREILGNMGFFFSVWVFFHEHSLFTGQQVKGEGIFLTPLYHFHPLHRHLDISRAITAESLPLHIARSRTRTGKFWFPSASRWSLSYGPNVYWNCLLTWFWSHTFWN